MDNVCWKCKQPWIFDLQRTVICLILFLLKKLKIHLIRNCFMWEWIHVFTFLHWIYSIHFINISSFVSNLVLYIWKCVQCQWTNNDIPSSFTVELAFLVGKWINCFVTDIIIERWVWSSWDRTGHGIA